MNWLIKTTSVLRSISLKDSIIIFLLDLQNKVIENFNFSFAQDQSIIFLKDITEQKLLEFEIK
jgi:hypothetical protein